MVSLEEVDGAAASGLGSDDGALIALSSPPITSSLEDTGGGVLHQVPSSRGRRPAQGRPRDRSTVVSSGSGTGGGVLSGARMCGETGGAGDASGGGNPLMTISEALSKTSAAIAGIRGDTFSHSELVSFIGGDMVRFKYSSLLHHARW